MASKFKLSPPMLCAGRTLSHLRVSPNGRFFAFLASDLSGTKLVVVPTDNADGGPELVVGCDPAPSRAHPHGGGVYDWLGDSSGLIYVAGNGDLYRVSLDGGPGELILDSTLAGWRLILSKMRRTFLLALTSPKSLPQ